MTDTFVALGFAIFIWWFSTGIVILLNRMSRTAVTMSLVISSALGLGALAGLSHTAQQVPWRVCLTQPNKQASWALTALSLVPC
ncbi:MAG: hypothetical protein RL686_1957 [Pseudomonadota bacterium]